MRRYQTGSAIFLLAVGAFFSLEARNLEIGRIIQPGPGFVPFWLGLALILLSLALILQIMRGKMDSLRILVQKRVLNSQGAWSGDWGRGPETRSEFPIGLRGKRVDSWKVRRMGKNT